MTTSVGILTYHNEYNLGATLQAFALQRTIQSLGYTCTIIDYDMPGSGPVGNFFHFRLSQLFHPRTCYCSVRHDLGVLANLRCHLELYRWHTTLRKRFARFQARHLVLTRKRYRAVSELITKCPVFDVFVVGSDQIWNPNIWRPSLSGCDAERVFYLDFVTSGRRVAYAPSLGISEMPAEYRVRSAELMSRFDFLSAREGSGSKIISELTGREVTQVLDPSLLLSSTIYEQVAVAPSYVGSCVLLYPMAMSEQLNELTRNVSKRLNLPIVAVLPWCHDSRKFAFADRVVFDAGPAEFLGWMGKAAFVCTNSFHGLAFSLIYRKPFLVVSLKNHGANTRIDSLLAKVGLLSRQVTDGQERLLIESLLSPINYSAIEKCLQPEVDASVNYLKKALE